MKKRPKNLFISFLFGLILFIHAPFSVAQTAKKVDNFAPRVCNLFPRGGGGNITSYRGIGCTWSYIDGKMLENGDRLILTAHRNANSETMAAYQNNLDGYFDGMLKYGIGTATPISACPSGTGRKYVRENDIDLVIVEGYLICEGHFISSQMVVHKSVGFDPKILFDNMMPQVLPLINSK